MCEEQMKGEYREDEEGMGDSSFHDALVCRIPYGAAVCYLSESQHHATRECKWCKLILTALTLINIELERHSESTFSSKANARFSIFFFFFFFKEIDLEHQLNLLASSITQALQYLSI